MRTTVNGAALKAASYAGTYVVVLAWDTADGQAPTRTDLLGYAIERAELDLAGHEVERYWMRGIKRFKDRDKGLPPGTPVSTAEHPIQSFFWADYTAKAGTHYRFRIVPLYGTVKNPSLDDAAAVTLDVITELEGDQPLDEADDGSTRHDVFFNRGVIGSQAYAREFGNREPDRENPRAEEMKWLSRGLFEALIRFIGLAGDGMGLRAAFYEFHYQPVANAFAKAIEAGADVRIVYDAESSYKAENEAVIHTARLDEYDAVVPRTVSEGIRHNKFIVLMKGSRPVAVWTGSTNVSAGGIFGHSNVGHVVWNEEVAEKYLAYWQRLADNLTPTKLRAPNKAATPTPAGKPPAGSVLPLFSARDAKDGNETLQWYADRLAEARELSCITFAFNIDQVFQQVLGQDNDVLRYVVKDDPLGAEESIGHDRDLIFAAGSYLGEGSFLNFLEERSLRDTFYARSVRARRRNQASGRACCCDQGGPTASSTKGRPGGNEPSGKRAMRSPPGVSRRLPGRLPRRRNRPPRTLSARPAWRHGRAAREISCSASAASRDSGAGRLRRSGECGRSRRARLLPRSRSPPSGRRPVADTTRVADEPSRVEATTRGPLR